MSTLSNVPDIADIAVMAELLEGLGVTRRARATTR